MIIDNHTSQINQLDPEVVKHWNSLSHNDHRHWYERQPSEDDNPDRYKVGWIIACHRVRLTKAAKAAYEYETRVTF